MIRAYGTIANLYGPVNRERCRYDSLTLSSVVILMNFFTARLDPMDLEGGERRRLDLPGRIEIRMDSSKSYKLPISQHLRLDFVAFNILSSIPTHSLSIFIYWVTFRGPST
jgi:hypothetical protein